MTIDLQAARQRARGAQSRADGSTPGPWYLNEQDGEVFGSKGGDPELATDPCVGPIDFNGWDTQFVIAARTDVPDLAALVVALADEVEQLRDALGEAGYNWQSFVK